MPSRKRVRESNPSLFGADPPPEFASTPEEVRRAVQRNAVQQGGFFALNLARLGFDAILDEIEAIARQVDLEHWRENVESLGINPKALDALDKIAVSYPYYFCNPDHLVKSPAIITYYRNVSMVSAKVMRGIGLATAAHETGQPLPRDKAEQFATYFNGTVSALIVAAPSLVTSRRHIEMALANLGASIDGSWRNEVGRLAYAEVIGSLLRYLHGRGCLSSVHYDLKELLILEADEDEEGYAVKNNLLSDSADFIAQLEEIETKRVVSRTLYLRNGNELRLNRQIAWADAEGKEYKIAPDLAAVFPADTLTWGGELKGGADPAGSDEHWKTATRAFERILEAAENTGRTKPALSLIATILVDRVAREAALWIQLGKLTSVYNLTHIVESEEKREAFLKDLAGFLGCNN